MGVGCGDWLAALRAGRDGQQTVCKSQHQSNSAKRSTRYTHAFTFHISWIVIAACTIRAGRSHGVRTFGGKLTPATFGGEWLARWQRMGAVPGTQPVLKVFRPFHKQILLYWPNNRSFAQSPEYHACWCTQLPFRLCAASHSAHCSVTPVTGTWASSIRLPTHLMLQLLRGPHVVNYSCLVDKLCV